MKKLDSEFRKDREKSKKACKEALDLGITPRRFKGFVFLDNYVSVYLTYIYYL
jgi:hypothetical protein